MIRKKVKGEFLQFIKRKRSKLKKGEDIRQDIDRKLKNIDKRKLRHYFSKSHPYFREKTIGILLMLIGLGFLINSLLLETRGIGFLYSSIIVNAKIGASLIIIGIFLTFIIPVPKERTSKGISSKQMTLAIIGWILVIFFITVDIDFDIFLILLIIGILIIKELADEFISNQLKNRMKILSFAFLMIFIITIGQKIISILTI